MPSRIAATVVLLVLSNVAMAQDVDLSHPLYQEELKTWNYKMLLDCSIKYETTVDVYVSLVDDPSEFAVALATWEHAHLVYFELAQFGALAQGLSAEDWAALYDKRIGLLVKPVSEAFGRDNERLTELIVAYLSDAQSSCAPYFETLRTRMLAIKGKIHIRT